MPTQTTPIVQELLRALEWIEANSEDTSERGWSSDYAKQVLAEIREKAREAISNARGESTCICRRQLPLRLRRHWDFVDEDGCLHCNCGHGVVRPNLADSSAKRPSPKS